MLTDSSASDSPVKRRRLNKRAVCSSDEDDSDDSPIKKWKGSRRKRLSSSSSQNSDIVAGPSSRKPRKLIYESESDPSDMSSDSEADEIYRPLKTKELNARRSRAITSDSDASSVDDEVAAVNRSSPNRPECDAGDSSNSEDGERCIICFKSLRPPMARPSNCNHTFHSECLIAWSKTSNTCPFDRVKYTEILVANALGELLDRHTVTTPPPQNHNAEEEEPHLIEGETLCEVCYNHDREHEMLLCDRCEAGYHLDCLSPPLDSVPGGTWYCPICSALEQEEEYSNDDSFIDEDEYDDLLRDAMDITGGRPILGSRRRRNARTATQQQRRTNRNTRTRNIQTSNNRAVNMSQPSTSSNSNTPRQRRRNTTTRRRKTTGRYKVEMVTIEGTTITVKVATNIRRRRKINRRRKKRGRQTSGNVGTSSRGNSQSYGDYYPKPLDINGSRIQLDYFSGCEGGDELDNEEHVNAAATSSTSSSAGNVLQQRRIDGRNINLSARRKANKINYCNTPVDLLSTILDQQEKWHNPKSTFRTNSLGEVTVVLHGQVSSTGPMPSKTIPDVTRNNGSNNNNNSNDNSNNNGGDGARASSSLSPDYITSYPPPPVPVPQPVAAPPIGSSAIPSSPLSDIPPLQPPPQPPAKLCVDDDDFDLYADIEPSTSLGFS